MQEPIASEPQQAYELPLREFGGEFIPIPVSPFDSVDQIPSNRLDESFASTFGKDLGLVLHKFRLVILPSREKKNITKFRHWDLWGPFFLLVLYVLFVDNGNSFSLIITTIILGASITSFNIRSLGGHIGYFQAVSILGYCMFPLILIVFVFQILYFLKYKDFAVRAICIILSCAWCVISASAFVTNGINSERRFVGVFPISIFYIYLATHLIFI